MNIVTTIKDWQMLQSDLKDISIGFVPTMGNLHAGHISLCTRAQMENKMTVASIFVNPAQFNEANDYNLYPRTLDADIILLKKQGVDYLFLPNQNEIYSDHYEIQIAETNLSKELEGEFRPGHFTGMLTVVLKLLNIVKPHNAYFGEKDYQQLLLIKKMVSALFLPIEIIACPTVRAEDGLALSSRNTRLSETERKLAAHFPKLLSSQSSLDTIKQELQNLHFKIDYIAEKWERRLGAVWLGNVRLIDNIALNKG